MATLPKALRRTGGEVVGAAGFELATYGTQNRRATRLRYAPTPHPLAGSRAEEKA